MGGKGLSIIEEGLSCSPTFNMKSGVYGCLGFRLDESRASFAAPFNRASILRVFSFHSTFCKRCHAQSPYR